MLMELLEVAQEIFGDGHLQMNVCIDDLGACQHSSGRLISWIFSM